MTDLDVDLAAIAAGDDTAFARWVSAAEPSLRRGLGRYAEMVDVEVVVQESLLRAWQLAPKVKPDGQANCLLRLTQRIASNLALDEIRRRKHQPVPHPVENDAEAEPSLPDPWLRQRIQECRERLPQKAAQALDARLVSRGDEPDSSIAERLGMRLNTFLKTFGRARQMLAECLEKRGVSLQLTQRERSAGEAL